MPTIADQLTAIKTAAATHLPSEIAEAFATQQSALAASAAPTIATGTVVPDAALLTATGASTTLADALDGSPAVVVFYRGGWCPYCNVALRSYQSELLPQLAERGVKLVAISPQRPDESLSTAEKAELTFAVLSDPRNTLAEALGIVDNGTDEVRAAQAAIDVRLAEVNEDGDVRLPMPTVLVIDAERTVRWAEVHPDYTTRSETAPILAAVASL